MLAYETMETDVLVIGGGGAGALAALAAAERGARVVLATKGPFPCGNTSIAIGGYAVPLGHADPADGPEAFFEDALIAGAGLNDPQVVRAWAEASVPVTLQLVEWGLPLARKGDGFHQRPNFGHRYPRSVRCRETIGKPLMDCLAARVEGSPIRVLEHLLMADLLTEDGVVRGAYGFNYHSGREFAVRAGATVLATGGAGHAWALTDNPVIITGDGYAMGWRAGAELVEMEMTDFQLAICHPENLRMYPPHSNAMRFRGGRFYNGLGERFMKRHYPEHADAVPTRAAVCRAAALEIHAGRATRHGGVYLDCSDALAETAALTPKVYQTIQRGGVDLTCQPLEMAPAAHTFLGGVRIDATGKTTLEGLYAAGETAGGVHGANRLGGGALSDALTFGVIAGRSAAARAREEARGSSGGSIDALARDAPSRLEGFRRREGGVEPLELRRAVQETMAAHVMVVREEIGLLSALDRLATLRAEVAPRLSARGDTPREVARRLREVVEAINLLQVASLVAKAALLRRETRGAHYRLDHPQQDDRNWLKNVVLSRSGEEVTAEVVPAGTRAGLSHGLHRGTSSGPM